MFKKKNASSNLKRSLHLETKIKSNEYLGIGTEGVCYFHFCINTYFYLYQCVCLIKCYIIQLVCVSDLRLVGRNNI